MPCEPDEQTKSPKGNKELMCNIFAIKRNPLRGIFRGHLY